MKDDNCIFCKLANGDIPTNSIYEDDDFKVILDASPATKGHALILPKQHYANIFEIEDETLAKAAKLAKKIMTHEKDVLGCEGDVYKRQAADSIRNRYHCPAWQAEG